MPGKNSLKELRIGIGDIVFSAVSNDPELRLEADARYRQFITNAMPDVVLWAHYGYLLHRSVEKKIFDTGVTWSLYHSEGKIILRVRDKLIILKPNFKSGDIYIGAEGTSPKVEYPLSYPLDEVLMINLLAQGRGVMIHSCGVSSKGQGLLFAGTSQMGKSTMANLWKSQIANSKSQNEGENILSDDRIIIRKMDGQFQMYGTPWHGDAKICSPERAPLKKIFFLKHDKNNIIKKINPVDATSRLIVCSFPTFWDKKGMEFTLKFCAELAKKVPCYELGFVPDESVLDFVRNV
ncbi:hypothetical protein KAT51_04255 [bacterium]|nr:hypothetical protein [bacterium]